MLNKNDIRIEGDPKSIIGYSNDILTWGYGNYIFQEEYMTNPKYIEAILLRIPLSPIYLDGRSQDGNRVILKGGESLWSIKCFIENQYSLQGMKFFPELEGKFYKDLPRPLQRRIHETYIMVYTVERGTPDEALEYIL